MDFYIRVDGASAWESDFMDAVIGEFAEKVRSFLHTNRYGEKIETILPILLIRRETYWEEIKANPSLTDIFPPTKYKRSEKMLTFIVEIRREDVYNKNLKAHYNVAAAAVIKGLKNANVHSKFRIDFDKLIQDLECFFEENGWQYA